MGAVLQQHPACKGVERQVVRVHLHLDIYRLEAIGGKGASEGRYLGFMTSQGIKLSHKLLAVDLEKERRVERQKVRNMMA